MGKHIHGQLCLADGRLGVVAADVVELDPIVVEVVEDGQAELVAFTIVRLRNATSAMMIIVCVVCIIKYFLSSTLKCTSLPSLLGSQARHVWNDSTRIVCVVCVFIVIYFKTN